MLTEHPLIAPPLGTLAVLRVCALVFDPDERVSISALGQVTHLASSDPMALNPTLSSLLPDASNPSRVSLLHLSLRGPVRSAAAECLAVLISSHRFAVKAADDRPQRGGFMSWSQRMGGSVVLMHEMLVRHLQKDDWVVLPVVRALFSVVCYKSLSQMLYLELGSQFIARMLEQLKQPGDRLSLYLTTLESYLSIDVGLHPVPISVPSEIWDLLLLALVDRELSQECADDTWRILATRYSVEYCLSRHDELFMSFLDSESTSQNEAARINVSRFILQCTLSKLALAKTLVWQKFLETLIARNLDSKDHSTEYIYVCCLGNFSLFVQSCESFHRLENEIISRVDACSHQDLLLASLKALVLISSSPYFQLEHGMMSRSLKSVQIIIASSPSPEILSQAAWTWASLTDVCIKMRDGLLRTDLWENHIQTTMSFSSQLNLLSNACRALGNLLSLAEDSKSAVAIKALGVLTKSLDNRKSDKIKWNAAHALSVASTGIGITHPCRQTILRALVETFRSSKNWKVLTNVATAIELYIKCPGDVDSDLKNAIIAVKSRVENCTWPKEHKEQIENLNAVLSRMQY